MTQTQNPLEVLTKAVSEYYESDSTKPGVLVSYLPDDKYYYVAVHRYFSSGGRNKQVVASAKAADINVAANIAANAFLNQINQPKVSEVDRLRRLVRAN